MYVFSIYYLHTYEYNWQSIVATQVEYVNK